MLTLCDNPAEKLTADLWEKWQNAGYNNHPHALTWMEVNNLSKFYVQLCKSTGADYRDFDFETLLDHTLTYYENKSLIENTVGQPQEASEQTALAELNSRLQEDYGITIDKKLKPHSELEQTVKSLEQELREVKAQRSQLAEQLKVAPKEVVKTVEVIKEVPVIKTVPAQPDPDKVQYSKEELAEILEYMQKRKNKKTYNPKLKTACTLTAKAARGTFNVLSLAAWKLYH